MQKFLLLLLFLCSPLFADNPLTDLAQEGQTYNYWKEFFNMLLTLGFVLALIFFSVWILKKVINSRTQTLNRSNGIKILERRPLNPKACLYLVDILGKGVVISESPSGIQLITELSDQVNIEERLEQLQEEEIRPTFYETMAKKLRRNA